jgi:hypothetical protein
MKPRKIDIGGSASRSEQIASKQTVDASAERENA